MPLGWRSGPTAVLLGCGAAALTIAAVAMTPLWRTIGRHRAVLVAYGIPVSEYGQVQPTATEITARRIRAAEGMDRSAEARRTLRVRRTVVVLSTLLLAANAFVAVRALGRVKTDNVAVGVSFVTTVVVGLVLLMVVANAHHRVVRAAAGGIGRAALSGIGPWVFIVAWATGIFAGNAAHLAALDGQPHVRVAGQVDRCDTGRSPDCYGTWVADGRTYSGEVPFSPRTRAGRCSSRSPPTAPTWW